MRNFDEPLLRGRRIQSAAGFSTVQQALRIALHDGYAARAFYAQVNEAFGARPPFAAITLSQARHIEKLGGLCQRYGVPRPLDPFAQETRISPSWRGNLERAVAGELAKVQLYQQLLSQLVEPDIQRELARLQRASLDKHLPAFQRALQQAIEQESLHAQHGVPAGEAYMQHGPISDFMEKAFSVLGSQHRALGFVAPLLRAHPALLAGLAAGAAGTYLIKKRVQQNGKEE